MADWQTALYDTNARMDYILRTEKWCDCTFLVGGIDNQIEIKAHKVILSMTSPVFEKMFFGPMAEKNDPIIIPDVPHDAFGDMLNYIYKGKINVYSVEKAFELTYVAQKYMIPHITQQCIGFLWSHLCIGNVCQVLEYAKLFNVLELKEFCFEIISDKTQEVLDAPSFINIEPDTLLDILDQDELNIDSELELFDAVRRYAEGQGIFHYSNEVKLSLKEKEEHSVKEKQLVAMNAIVDEQNGDDKENLLEAESSAVACSELELKEFSKKRLMIHNAIKKIRFLTLTVEQFADGPGTSNLFIPEEALCIMLNLVRPKTQRPLPSGFCTNRLKRTDVNPVLTNQNCSPPDETVSINLIRRFIDSQKIDVDCVLDFFVQKNILIKSIELRTQVLFAEQLDGRIYADQQFKAKYSENIYVHLRDKEESHIIYGKIKLVGDLTIIQFITPILLDCYKEYEICVLLQKLYSSEFKYNETIKCILHS